MVLGKWRRPNEWWKVDIKITGVESALINVAEEDWTDDLKRNVNNWNQTRPLYLAVDKKGWLMIDNIANCKNPNITSKIRTKYWLFWKNKNPHCFFFWLAFSCQKFAASATWYSLFFFQSSSHWIQNLFPKPEWTFKSFDFLYVSK